MKLWTSKVTNWLQTIIYNCQEMKRWGRKEYLLDALTPLGNFPRVPQGCASLRIHDWCEGTSASKYMRHAVKTFGKAA
jgi:hypothetical protein